MELICSLEAEVSWSAAACSELDWASDWLEEEICDVAASIWPAAPLKSTMA